MSTLLYGIHLLLLGLLCLSALSRVLMLWPARLRRAGGEPPAPLAGDDVPEVLVQLPLYNEPLVAERLLRSCAHLDWPRHRLVLQVLDDSTDATAGIVDAVSSELRSNGVRIDVVRRRTREGFKAGALAAGLRHSEASLIAIFDADFIPPRDFLRRMVPSLDDPEAGLVQARWAHLNADRNLLTAAQAALLDGHFQVEQRARFHRGHFFNFNGTAGLWRRQAIEDAGGWQADTLTEDLDLSYRAQLAGWRFVYRDDVAVPAELPTTLDAFRTQQRRWAKGGLETLRKLARPILRSRYSLRLKLAALAHLSANANYILLAGVAITLPLLAFIRPDRAFPVVHGGMLLVGLGGAALFTLLCQRTVPWRQRLLRTPLALLLDVGIAHQKAAAAIEALRGRRTPFVRTPKSGDVGTPAVSTRESTTAEDVGRAPGFHAEPLWALWSTMGAAAALSSPDLIHGAFLLAFALAQATVGLTARRHRLEVADTAVRSPVAAGA